MGLSSATGACRACFLRGVVSIIHAHRSVSVLASFNRARDVVCGICAVFDVLVIHTTPYPRHVVYVPGILPPRWTVAFDRDAGPHPRSGQSAGGERRCLHCIQSRCWARSLLLPTYVRRRNTPHLRYSFARSCCCCSIP